ncbi:MAG: hypothetical protein A3F72_03105 [Bacteroidetes bacterium RIFCSPLOWO2_12_FULL_35_15]|nr:MAG: hypothetical protein A3F72_03105 [Bacteroidetes bacterium RIFCSPLOWO2_12_FULL_35_15]
MTEINRLQPEKKIIEIIFDVTGTPVSQITETSRFAEDIGADSLDMMTIGYEVESAFEIALAYDDVNKLKTVNDLIQLVVNLTNSIENESATN